MELFKLIKLLEFFKSIKITTLNFDKQLILTQRVCEIKLVIPICLLFLC